MNDSIRVIELESTTAGVREFGVRCDACDWAGTELPHSFLVALGIAQGHNRGTHKRRCFVITPSTPTGPDNAA